MKTMMALLALMGMAGCLAGESELAPRTASAEPATASAEQPLVTPAADTTTDQICRSLMQRQRGCTAQFIPALVDARVKGDNPPGAAAREREIDHVLERLARKPARFRGGSTPLEARGIDVGEVDERDCRMRPVDRCHRFVCAPCQVESGVAHAEG